MSLTFSNAAKQRDLGDRAATPNGNPSTHVTARTCVVRSDLYLQEVDILLATLAKDGSSPAHIAAVRQLLVPASRESTPNQPKAKSPLHSSVARKLKTDPP